MRTVLIILFFFVFPFAVQAATFFCAADGYSASGQLVSVSGEEKSTEKEAEESAIKVCRSFGYSVCRISSCFQTDWEMNNKSSN